MARLRDESESTEATTLSTEVIGCINKRIVDPVLYISDNTLVEIIDFSCHVAMFNDASGTLTHFKDLDEIIRRKGGLQVLSSNPVLRTVVFCELVARDLWDDGVFAGLYVVPLVNKLLSIRHDISESNTTLARQEACRLGTLLYPAGIRQRFGVNLLAEIYIPELKEAIPFQVGLNFGQDDPVML
ncbi:hypothetical protein BKA61DRAFT_582917 [Leptodontidium sp. MPI-SDFR-AT-0119]|nr:hypothetical protein BKA61DRAFT_582917 [Leptodontidium sp. MPI-SDFR-AT-0119]